MGKTSKRRRTLQLFQAAQSTQAQQTQQRAARTQEIAASKSNKKGTHPTNPIHGQFTRPGFDLFYNEIIALAKETKDEAISRRAIPQNRHVFIHELLQKANIRLLIFEVFKVCCKHHDALNFQSLEEIIAFFSKNGVDITVFCDDDEEDEEDDGLQSRYDEDVANCKGGKSAFLKRMLLYTLRNEQHCCGKCGRKIDCHLFGGIGFESNHIKDDYAESDEDKIKYCEANITLFLGNLCDALYEISKTDLECSLCHDRHGYCRYDQLPDKVERDYNFPIRPCFEAQQSDECKQVLICIESLQINAAKLSFEDVSQKFSDKTVIHSNDAFGFNEERWNAANKRTRRKMLHGAYLSSEKRMTGGCYLCEESHCKRPLRNLRATDLHHVLPDEKDFNPSEGVNKSVDVSLTEDRKTCPLCKRCHMRVHHRAGENDRFMKKLQSKYCVDELTGEISFAQSGSR
eukprot:scaffold412_cov118-Skeletonema_marinoi.AAC.1